MEHRMHGAEFSSVARTLVISAPGLEDAKLTRQQALLDGLSDELQERDIMLVTVVSLSQRPRALDQFLEALSLSPQHFEVVLIGKDGTEKLRRHEPVSAEELFALVDSMPMRQAEMREA